MCAMKLSSQRPVLPPYAKTVTPSCGEVFIYICGTDADLPWRLACGRVANKFPTMLVPAGANPLNYRWPLLKGADVLIVLLPGANAAVAPRLALRLFDAGASHVTAVDPADTTVGGGLAVYRREARRVAA